MIALEIALKAVLTTAREHGLPLNELSEATIDRLVRYRSYDPVHVPMAINEIGFVVDVLKGE
jgi:hypothetical protein